MKLAEWLDARTPAPPGALARRVRASLAPVLESDVQGGASGSYDDLIAAARSLLHIVLRDESANRDCAHDLLAADALVTYAFELAAEDPDSIEVLADTAMRRLGALAAEGTT